MARAGCMLQVCWGRDCMQTTDCTAHSPRHTSSKQAKRKKSSSSLEKAMLLSLSIVILASLSQTKASSAPCYDHQYATYKTQFDPTECNVECTVTPFFSPDHSVTAYVSVIKAAAESIDVLEPGNKKKQEACADTKLRPCSAREGLSSLQSSGFVILVR